jgi:predicted nucleic acid-binding protein
MGSQTFLTDITTPLVADTSVIINLIATGCAAAIVRALPTGLVVVNVVPAELDVGRRNGRHNSDRLNELVDVGLVEIVNLGDVAMQHFTELVIGPATATLDDGEAATIAYAVERAGTALIDERKAIRICADRFPRLRIGSTVDILIHPEVQRHLDAETLATAVFNALQHGRMRVLPHHLEHVVSLIGQERAAQCQSLPKSVRLSTSQSPEHQP